MILSVVVDLGDAKRRGDHGHYRASPGGVAMNIGPHRMRFGLALLTGGALIVGSLPSMAATTAKPKATVKTVKRLLGRA